MDDTAAFEGALVLEELQMILGSCGPEGLVEFGIDAEEGAAGSSPWHYDASARVLALRQECVAAVWRAAKSDRGHEASAAATLLLMADDASAWNARKRALLAARERTLR